MLERLLHIDKLINGFGFGALNVVGGGKRKEVVADYHKTEESKMIELVEGRTAQFSVNKHDGYEANGTVTIIQDGQADLTQNFSLQKGQSFSLGEDINLVHEQRKK